MQLTFTDVNDNVPVVTSVLRTVIVTENSAAGTVVVTLSASDLDAGVNAQITYVIESGNTAGMLCSEHRQHVMENRDKKKTNQQF